VERVDQDRNIGLLFPIGVKEKVIM